MTKRKNKLDGLATTLALFTVIFCFVLSVSFKATKLSFFKMSTDSTSLNIILNFQVDHDDSFQLFYHREASFAEQNSIRIQVHKSHEFQQIVFHIPSEDGTVKKIRIDPGEKRGVIQIKSIVLDNGRSRYLWKHNEILQFFEPSRYLNKVVEGDDVLALLSEGGDPYIEFRGDLSDILDASIEIPKYQCYLFAFATSLLVSVLLLSSQVLQPRLIIGICISFSFFQILYVILQSVNYDSLSTSLFASDSTRLQINLKVSQNDSFQVFYNNSGNGSYSESNSVSKSVIASDNFQLITLALPPGNVPKKIRIDPGSMANSRIQLKSISLFNSDEKHFWNAKGILSRFAPTQHISHFVLEKGILNIYTFGNDPSFGLINSLQDAPHREPIYPLILSLVISLLTGAKFFSSYTNTSYTNTYESRGREVILTLSFLLIIFLPTISYLSPAFGTDASLENRRLAQKPEFKFSNILHYAGQFTDYFKDQFAFRNLLVQANSLFMVKFLHASPLSEKVIVGRQNWLFLSGDKVIDDYKGVDTLGEKSLLIIRQNLRDKAEWFARNGMKYYLIIIPEKSQIYPEYLPTSVKKIRQTSKYEQLVRYLKNDASIVFIDVRERLLNEKKNKAVYYKTDTHWNDRGAFAAYQEIVNRISKDFPNVHPRAFLNYSVADFVGRGGDLSRMVSIAPYSNDEYSFFLPNFENSAATIPYSYPYTDINVDAKQSVDTTQPKLVMYRDSFSISLIPFLSQNFSKSIYLWTPTHDYAMMQAEKPDIVIHAFAERYIYLLESP